MIPVPCVAESRNFSVDVCLGTYIDAPGRLVEDNHLRTGTEPFGDHQLLLVAT